MRYRFGAVLAPGGGFVEKKLVGRPARSHGVWQIEDQGKSPANQDDTRLPAHGSAQIKTQQPVMAKEFVAQIFGRGSELVWAGAAKRKMTRWIAAGCWICDGGISRRRPREVCRIERVLRGGERVALHSESRDHVRDDAEVVADNDRIGACVVRL